MNPGWGLNNAQAAIDDPQFHWYLNTGDMLSNGFASMVGEDTAVTWSKPDHSPLHNHGVAQWSCDKNGFVVLGKRESTTPNVYKMKGWLKLFSQLFHQVCSANPGRPLPHFPSNWGRWLSGYDFSLLK